MKIQLHKEKGFTLIELLVVMALILVLAGLIIAVIPFVQKKQANTRALGEIKTISVALEAYKADNGIYPDDANVATAGSYVKGYTDNLDARVNGDPTVAQGTAGSYFDPNLVLYRALSGDRNLDRNVDPTGTTDSGLDLDGNSLSTPLAAPPTSYYKFPNSMLLPAGGVGNVTCIVDPYGYPYGYSTAYQGDVALNNTNSTTTAPTHGYNTTFDLWSTAGTVALTTDSPAQTSAKRAQWVYNWQNSGANVGQ